MPSSAKPLYAITLIALATVLLFATALMFKPQKSAAPTINPPLSSDESAKILFPSGSYLQLYEEHRQWSNERWLQEFKDMKKLGLDKLIIQWSDYDTDIPFFSQQPNQAPSLLERLLLIADKTNIKVYVGLSLRPSWWDTENVNPRLIKEELERNTKAAQTINRLVGKNPAFVGWYIPHEITDLYYTQEQRVLLISFFSKLAEQLKKLVPEKPVLFSAYTNQDISSLSDFKNWWIDFFDNVQGIDVFIFQDGAGIAGRSRWTDIAPYLKTLATLMKAYPTSLWIQAESFTQTDGEPLNNNEWGDEPAPFSRLRRQLQMDSQYADEIVLYSFFEHMSPRLGQGSQQLFNDYLNFVSLR